MPLFDEQAARQDALIRQLQHRECTGGVNAGGSVGFGSGFSITKTGTGTYTITYDRAFPTLPAVLLSPIVASGVVSSLLRASAVTGFDAIMFTTTTGALVDSSFHFYARAS